MLNDHDLAVLFEIERVLEADDPAFAARCARLVPGGAPRGLLPDHDLSVALTALLTVVSTAVLWSRGRRNRA